MGHPLLIAEVMQLSNREKTQGINDRSRRFHRLRSLELRERKIIRKERKKADMLGDFEKDVDRTQRKGWDLGKGGREGSTVEYL